MRLPPPFRALGDQIEIELGSAIALFTTRRGGVSENAYASLNLGTSTEDDEDHVRVNRARVAELAGLAPEGLLTGRQVHGTDVRRVGAAGDGGADATAEADGQATSARGHAPMVLVADCLPIALAGDGAVAMLHGGWRGLAGGIVGEGVRALEDLGASGPISAAIGPGAGLCCYTVDEDVHATFAARDLDFRESDRLDLKLIARRELERAGVARIHDVGLCTICPTAREHFFSHRRDRGVTGRQAGLVWRVQK
ncbi:MAG TPA: polyphenol oxidase family protein [Solirubrobacteraceae bacterium]|nr:polyphenol oxidase family protein [Solirubrobacteraceae bacterium]